MAASTGTWANHSMYNMPENGRCGRDALLSGFLALRGLLRLAATDHATPRQRRAGFCVADGVQKAGGWCAK